MKKVLITGADSYIGTSVENWLSHSREQYEIHTLDMKQESWRAYSFAGYDAVFHVAGIAHVSADPNLKELYHRVNCELTIETAKKAKQDGVRQFIFMSSIIVYGNSGVNGLIDKNTKEAPVDFYGQSKLDAEAGIRPLADADFKVVIIRPPMIYGKNSKGNYPRLAKMATKLPIFPMVENRRSMLHIDNLCEFIRLVIAHESEGTFYPQNEEYVNTSKLVKEIAACHGKKMILVKGFGGIIKCFSKRIGILRKVFGNLMYEQDMSKHFENTYCVADFAQSIQRTEV